MKLKLKITSWTILAISFILIMIACGKQKNTTGEEGKLQAVNQELLKGDVAPALERIGEVDVAALSDDSKPLYYLLLTQARYKNYIDETSDSLINIALTTIANQPILKNTPEHSFIKDALMRNSANLMWLLTVTILPRMLLPAMTCQTRHLRSCG